MSQNTTLRDFRYGSFRRLALPRQNTVKIELRPKKMKPFCLLVQDLNIKSTSKICMPKTDPLKNK